MSHIWKYEWTGNWQTRQDFYTFIPYHATNTMIEFKAHIKWSCDWGCSIFYVNPYAAELCWHNLQLQITIKNAYLWREINVKLVIKRTEHLSQTINLYRFLSVGFSWLKPSSLQQGWTPRGRQAKWPNGLAGSSLDVEQMVETCLKPK